MSDQMQTVGCDTNILSVILKDIVQVLRQEFVGQNEALVLALTKELDGMAKLIAGSIMSELCHLRNAAAVSDARDEVRPCGTKAKSAQTFQNSLPSEVYNLARDDADDGAHMTHIASSGSHGANMSGTTGSERAHVVQSASHVAQPAQSAAQKMSYAQCSSPSVVQLMLEKQLEELTHKSLVQPGCNWKIREWLHSTVAERVLAMLIIANAAMFGVQADHAIAHPYDDPPRYLEIVERCFIIIFSIELIVRLLIDGFAFFSCMHPEFNWNCLDFVLVVLAYLEALLTSVNLNFSSARLLRMLRMVRMLKLMRVLKDIRLMVFSILVSCRPLLWAMVLLALGIYTFAIILLQLLQNEIAELSDVTYFTSLSRLMFSLFMCISGGVSWTEVLEPIRHINPVITPLFGAYISFAVFCVLNIVTGIFCDQSRRVSQEDEENLMIEEIQSRKKWMADIEAVFHQADINGNGELSLEEFVHSLRDLRLQTAMKNCGIDLMRMSLFHVFEILDFDQSGKIDISTFAFGLQHIHGDAKAIDIARVKHELRDIRRKLNQLVGMQENLEQPRLRDHMNSRSSTRIILPSLTRDVNENQTSTSKRSARTQL